MAEALTFILLAPVLTVCAYLAPRGYNQTWREYLPQVPEQGWVLSALVGIGMAGLVVAI